MHTVSRGIFRKVKERWETQVLASDTVKKRLTTLDALETFPGGPRYDDVLSADDATRARQAGGFMHAIGYQLMARNPGLWSAIQVYRDQYRLAAVSSFLQPPSRWYSPSGPPSKHSTPRAISAPSQSSGPNSSC